MKFIRCINRLFYLLMLCVLFCAPKVAHSQTEESLDDATNGFTTGSYGFTTLPGPRDEGQRFIIDNRNELLFRDVLLPQVSSWLKNKSAAFLAVSSIDFVWSLSTEWNRNTEMALGLFEIAHDHGYAVKGSVQNVDTQSESSSSVSSVSVSGENASSATAPNGNVSNSVPETGFLFGNAQAINKVEDPETKAYQILWNMTHAIQPTPDVLYGIDLRWIGKQKLIREASGAFYRRIEPRNSYSQGHQSIMSRDVLKLFSPQGVLGFGALSHRYYGTEDDAFWMYSPVIGRGRRLLSSNRSDTLLGGLLSYDDFFLWSMKIESVDASCIEEKMLLLPFPSLGLYTLDNEQVSVKIPSPQKPQETKAQEVVGQSSSSAKSVVSEGQAEDEITEGGKVLDEPLSQEVIESVITARGYHKGKDNKPVFALWNYETQRFQNVQAWVPVTAFLVPRKVWMVEVSPRDPYNLSGRQMLVIDQESFLPFYKIVYNRKGEYEKIVMAGWGLATTGSGEIKVPVPSFVLAVDESKQVQTAITTRYVRVFLGKQTPASQPSIDLLDISKHGGV